MQFLQTPVNIDYYNLVPPIGDKLWTLPQIVFDLNYGPFYKRAQPLNRSHTYQKQVVNHISMRLTEKWLYHDVIFRDLFKYFKCTVKNKKCMIELVGKMDQTSSDNVPHECRSYVLSYIEDIFLSKKLVDRAVRSYVKKTGANWYDLFNQKQSLLRHIHRRLRKLIRNTIYELEGRKKVVALTE